MLTALVVALSSLVKTRAVQRQYCSWKPIRKPAKLAAFMLAERGYTVLEAGNWAEALALFR
jgi:hypothetical protein